MSSLINKIKAKTTSKPPAKEPEEGSEATYGILPHPAMTNDPADLERPQPGGGLQYNNPEQRAFHATGPQIPTQEMTKDLPPPQSREELRARAAELNKPEED